MATGAATGHISHSMTTTAFEIDGYKITRNAGIVRGIIVRSRSVLGTLGASLQTLVGGNITILTELCEKTRNEAFELMLAMRATSAPTASSACATTLRKSCRA